MTTLVIARILFPVLVTCASLSRASPPDSGGTDRVTFIRLKPTPIAPQDTINNCQRTTGPSSPIALVRELRWGRAPISHLGQGIAGPRCPTGRGSNQKKGTGKLLIRKSCPPKDLRRFQTAREQTTDKPRLIASPRTSASVGPTLSPPVVDGLLDDQCWKDSVMVSGFVTLSGEWAKQQTTAMVTYDKDFLYIACRLNEPLLDKLVVHTDRNDQEVLFNDDRIEIFLDTNHDGISYYHLLINSKGAHFDERCRLGEGQLTRDVKWNPDWDVKTSADGGYWTIEMRIAFAALGETSPDNGRRWGINLCRERRTVDLTELSTWAMTRDGINRPREFGDLIFGRHTDLSYSVVSVGNRLNNYELVTTVRNLTDTPLSILAQWSIESPQIDTATSTVREHLAAKSEKQIRLSPSIGGHDPSWIPRTTVRDMVKATLGISNTETEAMYESREGAIESPVEMDVSLSRYYYYPPESAEVPITLTNRSANGGSFEVEVRRSLRQEALLARKIPCQPGKSDYATSFNLADLEWGRYVVSAHLLDTHGKGVSSMDRVFYKMPIRERHTTPQHFGKDAKAAVRSDGVLLLNGKPFFPFSISPPVEVSLLAKDSFNTHYWPQAATTGLEISTAVSFVRVGLPWVTREQESVFVLWPKEKDLRRSVRSTVERLKSDPTLYSWHIQYESGIPLYSDTMPRIRLNNAEEYRKVSGYIKGIDPNHLTALELELTDNIDIAAAWRDSADIIEVALPPSYARQMVPHFNESVEGIRRILGQGKPFVLWIGSTVPSPQYRTAEEIRCVSYLALLHGAAGIVFHMGHGGLDPATMARHWSVYPGLYDELQWVFDKLTAPCDVEAPRIVVKPDEIDYRVFPCNGRIYLVAVNTAPGLVKATITFPENSVEAAQVNVPLENRAVRLEGDGFRDTFTGFEPHVYELIGKRTPKPLR